MRDKSDRRIRDRFFEKDMLIIGHHIGYIVFTEFGVEIHSTCGPYRYVKKMTVDEYNDYLNKPLESDF